MTTINRAEFRFDPRPDFHDGTLLIERFRTLFHTERVNHVEFALEELCANGSVDVDATNSEGELTGRVTFYSDERTPKVDVTHGPTFCLP